MASKFRLHSPSKAKAEATSLQRTRVRCLLTAIFSVLLVSLLLAWVKLSVYRSYEVLLDLEKQATLDIQQLYNTYKALREENLAALEDDVSRTSSDLENSKDAVDYVYVLQSSERDIESWTYRQLRLLGIKPHQVIHWEGPAENDTDWDLSQTRNLHVDHLKRELAGLRDLPPELQKDLVHLSAYAHALQNRAGSFMVLESGFCLSSWAVPRSDSSDVSPLSLLRQRDSPKWDAVWLGTCDTSSRGTKTENVELSSDSLELLPFSMNTAHTLCSHAYMLTAHAAKEALNLHLAGSKYARFLLSSEKKYPAFRSGLFRFSHNLINQILPSNNFRLLPWTSGSAAALSPWKPCLDNDNGKDRVVLGHCLMLDVSKSPDGTEVPGYDLHQGQKFAKSAQLRSKAPLKCLPKRQLPLADATNKQVLLITHTTENQRAGIMAGSLLGSAVRSLQRQSEHDSLRTSLLSIGYKVTEKTLLQAVNMGESASTISQKRLNDNEFSSFDVIIYHHTELSTDMRQTAAFSRFLERTRRLRSHSEQALWPLIFFVGDISPNFDHEDKNSDLLSSLMDERNKFALHQELTELCDALILTSHHRNDRHFLSHSKDLDESRTFLLPPIVHLHEGFAVDDREGDFTKLFRSPGSSRAMFGSHRYLLYMVEDATDIYGVRKFVYKLLPEIWDLCHKLKVPRIKASLAGDISLAFNQTELLTLRRSKYVHFADSSTDMAQMFRQAKLYVKLDAEELGEGHSKFRYSTLLALSHSIPVALSSAASSGMQLWKNLPVVADISMEMARNIVELYQSYIEWRNIRQQIPFYLERFYSSASVSATVLEVIDMVEARRSSFVEAL